MHPKQAMRVLLSLLAVFALGCASSPEIRIVFPAASVNGQPARAVMDTGASSTLYFSSGAKKMDVKYSTSSASTEAIADPAQISFGRETSSLQLLVYMQPWYIGRAGIDKIDLIVGWPEFRNNILVFDNVYHTVRSVPELPPETSTWLKLKVTGDSILALETLLPDGQTGVIFIDTGMPYGVSLNRASFKSWRAAHKDAPAHDRSTFSPEYGITRGEEAWADQVELGALTLTDLPVGETDPPGPFKSRNFLGTIGMYALERMDLIVDAKNGFAYLHPKPPPGPPYPAIARPGVPSKAPADNNWTVDDSVQLNFAPLWVDVARQRKIRGDQQGALTDLNRALELDPGNVQALILRGDMKDDQADSDGAIADYSLAIKADPKNYQAYFNRGVAEIKRGDFDAAISDYSRDLELDPNDKDAYINRGSAKYNKHDYEGANADFDRALELDPKERHAWLGRGLVKLDAEDYAAVMVNMNRVIELDPQNAYAYLYRALCRQIQDDPKGALADYDKAVKIHFEDSAYAHLYREIFQLQSGKPSAKFADTVAGWKDEWPKPLGQFLAGRIDETALIAATPTKNQTHADGNLCEAYYFLGVMRRLRGDPAGARDYFQKSIAAGQKNEPAYHLARAAMK